MRLGFCGSPGFAVPVLGALVDAGHDVGLVVTRPDARRGRRAAPAPTPVKAAADRLGLDVAHDVTELAGASLEASVVVAYGAMVPDLVLDVMPVVNLHLSLLPRWRGAAPLERAILAGDDRAGVCVMALEPTLDTGPLFSVESTEVDDKALSVLRDECIGLGTSALLRLLSMPTAAWPVPEPQVGEPTYAKKLRDDELELDFTRPAREVLRVVRLERARTSALGRRLLVLDAEVIDERTGEPGSFDDDVVACGTGSLRLVTVVPEGRRAMTPGEWRRGLRGEVPTHLGVPRAP
jgi:methionyl-tRNA formyltransferase